MNNDTDLKVKHLKRSKLRYNEYYNLQGTFDLLYQQSKNNCKFKNLYDYIIHPNNIALAYRNIKTNKGSKTKGTDNENIKDYSKLSSEQIILLVQNKLENYKPRSIRRVEIPKKDGKMRPLGIPCFIDRLVQQCIYQVLEPICEAKFYNHSYGFRPNRSTKHAIGRLAFLTNLGKNHYCVDIDIKGFFDNINHAKLLKQIWSLGIHDKRVLSIINKIIKSEVEGVGKNIKGVPQGGILSPLLSNIVLNEFDWWIANQWEYFETKHQYSTPTKKYRALKTKNLKEVWIVRYADDFKILCKDNSTAIKIFKASEQWLKERLGLEVSKEKSKITNLKKNFTEFLGFKAKLKMKKKRYVLRSRPTEGACDAIKEKLTRQIKRMQKYGTAKEVNKYNAQVLGIQNYYNTATDVTVDFGKINYVLNRKIYNRIGRHMKNDVKPSPQYKKIYKGCKAKRRAFAKVVLFPFGYLQHKPPMNFDQNIINFTSEGRKIIHDTVFGIDNLFEYLLNNSYNYNSIELADNMMSKMSEQKGKCAVLSIPLRPSHMECHHITARCNGGSNEYKNLVWLNKDIHKLIHATKKETINKYKELLNLSERQIRKVNDLKRKVGNINVISLSN